MAHKSRTQRPRASALPASLEVPRTRVSKRTRIVVPASAWQEETPGPKPRIPTANRCCQNS